MAENGFWPSRLVGIRKAWDAAAINDLADSYGQEWVMNTTSTPGWWSRRLSSLLCRPIGRESYWNTWAMHRFSLLSSWYKPRICWSVRHAVYHCFNKAYDREFPPASRASRRLHHSRNLFVIFCLIFMPVVTIALIYIPGLNRAIFLERLQWVLTAVPDEYRCLAFFLSFSLRRPLWWLCPVPFALIIFGYDELRKLFIRKHPDGWVARETYH